MKAMLKATGMTAALAIGLLVLAGLNRAQDEKAPPSPAAVLKAIAQAGEPGVEHKKLQPFVGDWTFTLKMWTDPSQPPAQLQGTVQRKWIMGGRFVQESVRGECDGKTFEGMGLLGYDSAQKKFSSVKACGFCAKVTSNCLTANASGTSFTCAVEECCPLTGEKIKGRDEILIESNDRIVVNMYRNVGGKEVKAMELVSIRTK
ncbi:MAG: DUF1579 domain-containing protein [Gemmataceae bacterium]|nr:DUF1579 domain-containing protein [Gemmataceae bacterium]